MSLLRELGAGFVAYSPLGRGFLAGAIRSRADVGGPGDARSANPRFSSENFEPNLGLVEQVKAVAADAGATPGQDAIAWLLTCGGNVAPIPGTRHVSRLEENVAADAVTLTRSQVEALTAVTLPVGEHDPEDQMRPLER